MDKLKYIKLENEDGSYSESIPLAVDSDHVDVNGETLTNELNNKANNSNINNLQNQINGLASGSPLVASSTSSMTDTTRVYVNTTDGNWYYYNGSSWVSGGVYQSTGIGDETINFKKLTKDVQKNIVDSIRYIDFKNEYREYQPTFVQGRIDVDAGNLVNSNTQISTSEFMDVSFFDKIMLKISNRYNVFAFKYDSNKSYLGVINTPAGTGYQSWKEDTLIDVSDISYIKVGVAKPDYSNITPSAGTNLQIVNIYWLKNYFESNLHNKENVLNFEAGGIGIDSSKEQFRKKYDK